VQVLNLFKTSSLNPHMKTNMQKKSMPSKSMTMAMSSWRDKLVFIGRHQLSNISSPLARSWLGQIAPTMWILISKNHTRWWRRTIQWLSPTSSRSKWTTRMSRCFQSKPWTARLGPRISEGISAPKVISTWKIRDNRIATKTPSLTIYKTL